MLEEARTQCDYLIVGLQTDPTVDRPKKNKPIQSVTERYIQVDACQWVDEIIPYETEEDLLDLMQLIDFDVRIIGEEYREKLLLDWIIVLTIISECIIMVDIIDLQVVN